MPDYKNIKQLAEALHLSIDKLENGEMAVEQLEELVENSRELYERLIVLRFKSYECVVTPTEEEVENNPTEESIPEDIQEVKKQPEPQPVSPNQISLIDAIQEQERMLSLNDKLSNPEEQQVSLADRFKKSKIEDLRSAIGLNQKFLFMNDLFEGDNGKYNLALDELNNALSKEDALTKINTYRELYHWDEENKSCQIFIEIVERKFI
jgi:hypothetical protein